MGLQLADPATIQAFETTVVNADFLAIEAGIVVDRSRITTAEADIVALETITTTYDAFRPGTGGVANWKVTDLTALTALSTAEIGDTAYMTTPGTGIDALSWEAFAGSGSTIDWRVTSTVVAASKANLDSFIAAVAAISGTDCQFQIGKLAFVTGTLLLYRFTSTAGALHIASTGLVPIKPTSVAGTGVTLGADGKVSFTAATGASVNGCFTSDFSNYLIIGEVTSGSTTLGPYLRLRLAGTDETGSTYGYVQGQLSAAAYVAASSGTVAFWRISGDVSTTVLSGFDILVYAPAIARATKYRSHSTTGNATTSGNINQMDLSGINTQATAYDGFTLYASTGNFGGYFMVYGYNEN